MLLSRRDLLCLATAGAAALATRTHATPFVDHSGLAPGRFVWQPTVAEKGPVVVVVSLAAGVVHVYRGGELIALSTCTPALPGRMPPTGVFTILDRSRPLGAGATHAGDRLAWGAAPVLASLPTGYPTADGIVRLPRELAELLNGELPLGSVLIAAQHRSVAREVLHSGVLVPDAGEGARIAASIETHPVHTPHDGDLVYPVVALVVSAADRKAYLLRNGVIAEEAAVTIAEHPARGLGEHVLTLVGVGPDRTSLRWLAFAIASAATAPHIASMEPETTLGRIAFADADAAIAFAQALHKGAALVLTDATMPAGANRRAGTIVAVTGDPPSARTRPGTAQAPRPSVRERAATQRSRRRPDPDETFPFTIYWPYENGS